MILLKKISMFGVVGVINTMVDILVVNAFILLGTLSIMAVPFVFSRSMGFFSAMVVSYMLNQRFVFSDRSTDRYSPLRFFTVTTITFFLSVGSSVTLYHSIQDLGDPHLVGTIAALFGSVVGASINFIGYHTFVFRKARAS